MGNKADKWSQKARTFMSVLLAFILVTSTLTTPIFAAGLGSGETEDKERSVLGASTSESDSSKKDKEEEESFDQEKDKDVEEEKETEYKETIEIRSEEELRQLATRVNGGDSLVDVLVVLENNIVVDGGIPWTPIGKDILTPFSGVFDGKDHTISGFRVATEEGKALQGGLFGYLSRAKVKGVLIADFYAPASTSGLFYSCTLSDVTYTRAMELGRSTPFSISGYGASDVISWNTGTPDPSPFSTNADFYLIKSPEQLIALSEKINDDTLVDGAGNNAASGSRNPITISLVNSLNFKGHSLISMGNDTTPAEGIIFAGNGCTISNVEFVEDSTGSMGVGLFGVTDNVLGEPDSMVSISNLRLDKVKINATGDAGAVVGVANESTSVSNVVVTNATISGAGSVGGIAGAVFGNAETPSNIRGCAVINSTLDSGVQSGGIAGDFAGASITECAVYGGTFSGLGIASGIAGMQMLDGQNRALISDIVVMGTTLDPDNGVAYGVSQTSFGSINNVFITDLKIPTGDLFIAADFMPLVVENVLTDMPSHPIIYDAASGAAVSNIVWDSIATEHKDASGTPSPTAGLYGNRAESTQTLTSGWVLNDEWVASGEKGLYYPQIRSLANSNIPEIAAISAAASIAAVSLEPGYSYADPSNAPKVLHLPKKAPNGATITWSGYEGKAVYDASADPNYGILSREENTVANFDLVATVGNTYTKKITGFHIDDSLLREKPRALQPGDTVSTDYVFKLTFEDNITYNPNVQGMAKLYTVRKDASGAEVSVLDQALACENSPEFSIDSTNKVLTIKFNLREGVAYRIELPEGAVVEAAGKNPSKPMDVPFFTETHNAPSIKFDNNDTATINIGSNQPVSMDALLKHVLIYEFAGDSTPIFNGSVSTSGISEYTGNLWVENTPDKSMKNIINTFPDDVTTMRYVIEDKTNLFATSGPSAGTYRIYFMVKNSRNVVSTRALTVIVRGVPVWNGNVPKNTVHIPWTSDLSVVLTAAKQGAVAVIPQKDGTKIPCTVKTVYNESLWEGVKDAKGQANHLEVEVFAVDPAASNVANAKNIVTVYLDAPLAYTMTPSPVTMTYTSEKAIEKLINFEARNFKSDAVEYDHNDNTYRKPGLYYVDIESDPQHVTDCEDPNCDSVGTHPKNSLDETFVVNIVAPTGSEIQNQWGKAIGELEKGENFSKETIQVMPSTYTLPVDVLHALEKQNFGRVEVGYNNEYRWGLYSNTLRKNYPFNDEYSLEMGIVNDKAVNNLLEPDTPAIQMRFAQSGKLAGIVEFDLNLTKAAQEYETVPKENIGLYRYNAGTNQLDLVSSAIVKEDGWASATLEEIYPSTYVLMEKSPGDQVVTYSDKYFKEFYIGTKGFSENGGLIDGDPLLIDRPTDPKILEGLATGDTLKDTIYGVNVENINSTPKQTMHIAKPIIVAVSIMAAIGILVFAGYRIFTKKERV